MFIFWVNSSFRGFNPLPADMMTSRFHLFGMQQSDSLFTYKSICLLEIAFGMILNLL